MDVERTYRRRKHCEDAFTDRAKLDKSTVLQKAQIQRATTQEHLDVKNRMRADKAKREQRWTKKTAGSPFGVDLWDEDSKLYNAHTMCNATKTSRQKATANAMMQDQSNRCTTAMNEIDTLGNLRKEKKQLQLDQRELKARLDLDKVEKRCAAAQLKVDILADEHQEMLAGKGHLDRAHSDFFTEPRLSAAERERLREKLYQWEPQELIFRGTSSWSSAGQLDPNQPTDTAGTNTTSGTSGGKSTTGTVSTLMTLVGLDFDKVSNSSDVQATVVTSIKEGFVANMPGYTAADLTVVLSKGSVVANVTITPKTGSDGTSLKTLMTHSKAATEASVLTKVKAIPSGTLSSILQSGKSTADLTATCTAPVEKKGTQMCGASGDQLPQDLKESEPPAEMPDFTDAGESVESPAERASTKDEEPAESELSVGNQSPLVKAESESRRDSELSVGNQPPLGKTETELSLWQ